MIFRQLFDYSSYTYTYLIGDEKSRLACLIDPVKDQIDAYLRLLSELDLTLDLALDTHVHADHITALGELRRLTNCTTMVGSQGDVACASDSFNNGMKLTVGSLQIDCLYTPGHTADSYSFLLNTSKQNMLFSGDTLLIRGTGRTDFQNGDAEQLYDSLHRLLALPDETIVYPGHDYKGWSSSTIAEEKKHNPRVQIVDLDVFIEHMNNLDLPDPKLMDIAVPANQACGNAVMEH